MCSNAVGLLFPFAAGRVQKRTGNVKEGEIRNIAPQVPTQYVHTLNATAAAIPRLVVAILENFQVSSLLSEHAKHECVSRHRIIPILSWINLASEVLQPSGH